MAHARFDGLAEGVRAAGGPCPVDGLAGGAQDLVEADGEGAAGGDGDERRQAAAAGGGPHEDVLQQRRGGTPVPGAVVAGARARVASAAASSVRCAAARRCCSALQGAASAGPAGVSRHQRTSSPGRVRARRISRAPGVPLRERACSASASRSSLSGKARPTGTSRLVERPAGPGGVQRP
ncbi:hypothetical protein ACH49_05535 [Streptomyces leeuwenhoekii]|uniref:Uncharacterized protein n=1 Tax=Streptomyces leeuwenhoekii TaxID=1437453 RepID=A0ABR5I3P7_STRLW|nr:hypothetical protein ACH49_05535 [Streptomyces leeuwenhoekii]